MSQESLSPQTLDEGEPLTLSCHIRRRAIPGSRIYWEKDGRPLINYGNVSIHMFTADYELHEYPHCLQQKYL